MAVQMFVGGENFDELRRDGNYYVDKTSIIYELVHDTKNKVTLFTRPRRFGKTLMMRMLESFFDIRRNSKDVFDGLFIAGQEDYCAEWMNQYPVLFITLKDAEALKFETAYAKLKTIIADVCKKHAYLGSSTKIDADDHDVFARLKAQTGSDTDVQNSLFTLCRMMAALWSGDEKGASQAISAFPDKNFRRSPSAEIADCHRRTSTNKF